MGFLARMRAEILGGGRQLVEVQSDGAVPTYGWLKQSTLPAQVEPCIVIDVRPPHLKAVHPDIHNVRQEPTRATPGEWVGPGVCSDSLSLWGGRLWEPARSLISRTVARSCALMARILAAVAPAPSLAASLSLEVRVLQEQPRGQHLHREQHMDQIGAFHAPMCSGEHLADPPSVGLLGDPH